MQSLTRDLVLYRTYSRQKDSQKENWTDIIDRTSSSIASLGGLSTEQLENIKYLMEQYITLPSGRWLWVGGTEWALNPVNYYGSYNCSCTNMDSWDAFAHIFDLGMQGCGTGANLESKFINQLFPIVTNIRYNFVGDMSSNYDPLNKHKETTCVVDDNNNQLITLTIGDSRLGWVTALLFILNLASGTFKYNVHPDEITLNIDLTNIRPKGTVIEGFGGIANPTKLFWMFQSVIDLLNVAAVDRRQLNYEECCLLCDIPALCYVAGNIRRSAGIRLFDQDKPLLKENLWSVDDKGNWSIDPKKDPLRVANHTRVFHHKPTYAEVKEAVSKQFYYGEGALEWAGEAVARSNTDVLHTDSQKQEFLKAYSDSVIHGKEYLRSNGVTDEKELEHRMNRYGLNPCGEILGSDFMCNLSEVHLNQIQPLDFSTQQKAFTAAAELAGSLLHHNFNYERYRYSRELDPIVGVSITGLFDFFTTAFGLRWLEWWEAGRPTVWGDYTSLIVPSFDTILGELCRVITGVESSIFLDAERYYLELWRTFTQKALSDYCNTHNLKLPSRCTCVQPSGCASRELLRVFDTGLIYADEIMTDGQGEVTDLNLSVRNGIPVTTGIANSPLQLIKITLNNGRTLRLTPNHRLSVNDIWVRADNLVIGQSLDYCLGEYTNSVEFPLQSVDLSQYTKFNPNLNLGEYNQGYLTNVKFPKETSPNLGYLVGVLFGNGCFSINEDGNRKRIRISHGNIEYLQYLQSLFTLLFGVSGSISSDLKGTKHELCIASKPIYDWFIFNGLAKLAKSKHLTRIPLIIRQSSKQTILGFIAGIIDTDGCIRKNGNLSIDMSSKPFLESLQQVGESVGLSFSLYANTKGQSYQKVKDMHGLSMSTFISLSDSIRTLNTYSYKAKDRPLKVGCRSYFRPYDIKSIEWELFEDYSFDFAVDTQDDDDSWYWAGCIKSHNTKSLLTGASPGWHPPFGRYWTRRITFEVNHPVARAAIDYGYNVIPGQEDKDDNGQLLNDPYDPRVTTWLIEVPCQSAIATIPGGDHIHPRTFKATAQLDFWLQVQQHWTTHQTSATPVLDEDEIPDVAKWIYDSIQNDTGYISVALLPKSNIPYPRLPYQEITEEEYFTELDAIKRRRKSDDFYSVLQTYLSSDSLEVNLGPAPCDSDKCLL